MTFKENLDYIVKKKRKREYAHRGLLRHIGILLDELVLQVGEYKIIDIDENMLEVKFAIPTDWRLLIRVYYLPNEKHYRLAYTIPVNGTPEYYGIDQINTP